MTRFDTKSRVLNAVKPAFDNFFNGLIPKHFVLEPNVVSAILRTATVYNCGVNAVRTSLLAPVELTKRSFLSPWLLHFLIFPICRLVIPV